MNWSLPKCGNIFPKFIKLLTRKRTKIKGKAARDTREYEKIRTRKLYAKLEVGQECLKHDEEKGIICKWCVESKQSLVAQNVLKSTRFYIDGCTSFKKRSPFNSYQEKRAVHLPAQQCHRGNLHPEKKNSKSSY